MTKQPIYKTSYRVFKTNDAKTFIEHPVRMDVHGNEPAEMLAIGDGGIQVTNKQQLQQSSIVSSQEIMGILGILELANGKYLLAITARKLAATIQSHKIWKITGGIAIPIGSASPGKIDAVPDDELAKYAVDMELLESIKHILQSGRLFYSTTYDLTHSLQHNYFSKVVQPNTTIVDDRYFFNEKLQSALIQACQPENDTTPWISRVIAGFAGMIDMDSKTPTTKTFQVVLISRINHRRLGTRYIRRGLDDESNVANNVEMEQIVFHHDFLKDKSISSYVQIRGSVPTKWGQDLDLSYRPRLLLADINNEQIWANIRNHYQDLKHQYIGEKSFSNSIDNGQIVCVNLLDDTGFEGPLTEIYENTVRRLSDPKIKYESFPMNKWCKKMNFTNMEILVDRVRLPLINSGWFVAEGDVPCFYSQGSLQVSKIQTGLARVSCLDSLDRTNLTCSIFARYVIPYQVQAITPGLPAVQDLPMTGVSPSEVRDPVAATRKSLENGYNTLTCLWADSGDAISLMYAGTGALKADVTRTGKRQLIQGSYADGMNSLTRYYLNNFTHGHLQDAYDLLTGKTSPQKILQLVGTEGVQKANRLKNPLIPRNTFPGYLIPEPVVKATEAVYFNTRDYVSAKKKNTGITEQTITTLKELAPERIESIFDLFLALLLFIFILVLTKIAKIRGQIVVDKPRFISEVVSQ